MNEKSSTELLNYGRDDEGNLFIEDTDGSRVFLNQRPERYRELWVEQEKRGWQPILPEYVYRDAHGVYVLGSDNETKIYSVEAEYDNALLYRRSFHRKETADRKKRDMINALGPQISRANPRFPGVTSFYIDYEYDDNASPATKNYHLNQPNQLLPHEKHKRRRRKR